MNKYPVLNILKDANFSFDLQKDSTILALWETRSYESPAELNKEQVLNLIEFLQAVYGHME